MDCLDAKQKLEPCARGDLSAADKAELDRHVATCEGCRLELELTRAVLGSSSNSADPADDPALVDPLLMEGGSDRVSFDAIEPEPAIELERIAQVPSRGPEPPRVLTSQLPEEPEELLDLAGIQPSAYDPAAIHLPHSEESFGAPSEDRAPQESAAEAPPSLDDVSFADLATNAPALAPAPASPSEPGAKSKTGSGVWDFEPVDPPRASAPPEESLTFAKEALDRKRGNASRGRQRARVLLVIGGAVGGLGLLGASVWMALAMREPVGSTEPSHLPAIVPPPVGQPGPTPSDSLEPSTEPPPALTGVDSSATKPMPPSVIKAGAAAGAMGTGAIAPQAGSVKPSVSKQTPTQPGSGPAGSISTATIPMNGDASTASGKPSPVPSPSPAAFRDDELGPAPRREPRILTVEPDAKPGDPSYVPDEAAKPAVEEPTKPVITAPIFLPPSQGTSPAPGAGSAAGTGTGSPSAVDRLHTLTATAAKSQDLETLRKLKTTWKSMIRSGTPQERGRTKREYADCLWSIQEITKRDADRKEALAAYREYVLHAPAGGADARTIKRMRHLEDILSDAP